MEEVSRGGKRRGGEKSFESVVGQCADGGAHEGGAGEGAGPPTV